MRNLADLIIAWRGAGNLASGAAVRLYNAGLRKLFFMEMPQPLAVRRNVSFSDAIYEGFCEVEGIRAERVESAAEANKVWAKACLAVIVDPQAASLTALQPDILIEATLSKRNIGIRLGDAPLVIGLGPGFTVGKDAHYVVETNRGLTMGRLLREGTALPDTGKPGQVMGYDQERVLRAPTSGIFKTNLNIGDPVKAGEIVGVVDNLPVIAQIDGLLRGLLRDGLGVSSGLKLGDIEPRENIKLNLVSDKGLALGGAILEAILERELLSG